ERSAKLKSNWQGEFSKWQSANPERAALLERLIKRDLPSNWSADLPVFASDKEVSTRKASGDVINALAAKMPELFGGSADLAESNNTTIEGGGSFLPSSSKMKGASPYGRIIHFGIREHAMGSILNGIALHGLARGFGGTFLVFSDYMRGAVRLAALMKLPVTFIWSHDSIGLGEDGPTHQPIEHIASLRAIPGLDVIRPADANEVVDCWLEIIKRDKAAGLLLSRQNLPVIDRSLYKSTAEVGRGAYIDRSLYKSTAEVGRGAYALNEVSTPDILIIASGSEVSIALKASEQLAQQGLKARVISAPCLEWYREQEQGYKDLLMPKSVKARVSVEAGIAQGWHEFIGDSGVAISLEHYGASASAPVLFKEFGFTAEAVVKACQESISKSSK
ncbi:MAG: hypothetical protein RIR72_283, partial [Actinomycetota bacterium]